nr:transposase [Burkholderia sp. Ac-20353]
MLARTFGCARFVYNHMLRIRTDAWQQRQEHVGYHETSAALTTLKKSPEHTWLNEVSSVPLQQALRHLQTAFANFFAKRAKYPNFRRKDGTQSAAYTASAFKWDGTSLKLAKMDAPLSVRWSRTIPKGARVTSVTVSKDAAGRYHVSMLCDDVVSAKTESIGKVGIDLGLTDFAFFRRVRRSLLRTRFAGTRPNSPSCNGDWQGSKSVPPIAGRRGSKSHACMLG